MSDKDEDETEESTKKISPGSILSFGSINLLLTLNLEKHDVKKYKIKFDKLESLENLKFLKKHKRLWKNVTLSSSNNTLNILLHINKSSKKIINIGYVAFQKIEYNDEQEEFEKFVKTVINENGLFITSCDVCPCTICIQLLLKYEEKEKKFLLCGEEQAEKKEKDVKGEDNNEMQDEQVKEKKEEKKSSKEEEKKSNKEEEKKSEKSKKDDENPFTKIKKDIVSPADFNFIYFNYNDYINGEFKGKITVEHLYEYFQTLKITTKSKIILNLEEENIDNNNNIFRDIMSITDIFIFYDKNKFYELLKQLKKEEDNYNTEKLYAYHYREMEKKLQSKEEFKQHEEEKIKNYKAFLEKNKTKKDKDKEKNKTRNNETQIKQNNTGTETKKENIYITQGENNNKDKESDVNNVNEMISKEEEKKNEEKEGEKEVEKDNKEKENENIKPSVITKAQPSNDGQDKEIINDKKSEVLIRDTVKRKSNSLSKKNKLLPITPSPPQPLDKNEMFDYFKLGICDRDPQRKSPEKLLLLFDEFKKIFFVKYSRNTIKPSISDFDLKLYPQMNVRNMKEILEYKKFMKSKFSEYIKIFMGTLLSVVVDNGQEKIDDNNLFLGYLCATNTIKKLAEIEKHNLPLPKEKEFFYPNINKNEVEKLISKANQRKKEQLFILDGNSKKNNIIKPYNPLLDKNLYSFFNSQNNKNFLKINGFINNNGEINYDPIYRETLGFSKFGKKDDKDVSKSFQTTNKFLIGYKKVNKGYSIYNETKSSVVLPPIEQTKRKPAEDKVGNTINEEENESGSGSGGSGSGSGDDSGSGSGSGD